MSSEAPYPPYDYSTSWELEWIEDLEEILEARADLAAAIAEGTEPKDWPITASQAGVLDSDDNKWPTEAIFPKKEGHTKQDAVRIN